MANDKNNQKSTVNQIDQREADAASLARYQTPTRATGSSATKPPKQRKATPKRKSKNNVSDEVKARNSSAFNKFRTPPRENSAGNSVQAPGPFRQNDAVTRVRSTNEIAGASSSNHQSRKRKTGVTEITPAKASKNANFFKPKVELTAEQEETLKMLKDAGVPWREIAKHRREMEKQSRRQKGDAQQSKGQELSESRADNQSKSQNTKTSGAKRAAPENKTSANVDKKQRLNFGSIADATKNRNAARAALEEAQLKKALQDSMRDVAQDKGKTSSGCEIGPAGDEAPHKTTVEEGIRRVGPVESLAARAKEQVAEAEAAERAAIEQAITESLDERRMQQLKDILGVESLAEMQTAANERFDKLSERIIEMKTDGEKTQEKAQAKRQQKLGAAYAKVSEFDVLDDKLAKNRAKPETDDIHLSDEENSKNRTEDDEALSEDSDTDYSNISDEEYEELKSSKAAIEEEQVNLATQIDEKIAEDEADVLDGAGDESFRKRLDRLEKQDAGYEASDDEPDQMSDGYTSSAEITSSGEYEVLEEGTPDFARILAEITPPKNNDASIEKLWRAVKAQESVQSYLDPEKNHENEISLEKSEQEKSAEGPQTEKPRRGITTIAERDARRDAAKFLRSLGRYNLREGETKAELAGRVPVKPEVDAKRALDKTIFSYIKNIRYKNDSTGAERKLEFSEEANKELLKQISKYTDKLFDEANDRHDNSLFIKGMVNDLIDVATTDKNTREIGANEKLASKSRLKRSVSNREEEGKARKKQKLAGKERATELPAQNSSIPSEDPRQRTIYNTLGRPEPNGRAPTYLNPEPYKDTRGQATIHGIQGLEEPTHRDPKYINPYVEKKQTKFSVSETGDVSYSRNLDKRKDRDRGRE